MNHYLHRVDYALWLATICLQWILLAAMMRRGQRARTPLFFSFIAFLCVEGTALLAIAQFLPYAAYFWAFYAGIAGESILLVLVVYEIFSNTFSPVDVLPSGTMGRLAALLVAGISIAVALALWTPAHISDYADSVTALLRTVHRSVALVVALALWSLVMYARSLGMPWVSRVARIAAGLLLCLSAQSFTRAGEGFVSQSWFSLLDRFSSTVFVATLLLWLRAIWRPDEITVELPSPEPLRKVGAALAEMRAVARSLKVVQLLQPRMKEE